jgi:hypothetical protein
MAIEAQLEVCSFTSRNGLRRQNIKCTSEHENKVGGNKCQLNWKQEENRLQNGRLPELKVTHIKPNV